MIKSACLATTSCDGIKRCLATTNTHGCYRTDMISFSRIRCPNLRSVALADGGYYEMVRSNFDRAERQKVVRPTNRYQTSIISQLNHYDELKFN